MQNLDSLDMAGVRGGAIRFTSDTGETLVRGNRRFAKQRLTRLDSHHRVVDRYRQVMFGVDWDTFSSKRGGACAAYPGGRHIACTDGNGQPTQFWR